MKAAWERRYDEIRAVGKRCWHYSRRPFESHRAVARFSWIVICCGPKSSYSPAIMKLVLNNYLDPLYVILLHPSICIHLQRALTDLNVCKHLSGPKFPTNIPLLINMANCYIQTSNRGDAEHTIELLRSYRRKFNCTKKSKSEWPTLQNV